MIERLQDLKTELERVKDKYFEIRGYFDIEKMKKKLTEIEEEMSSANFWNDQKKAQSISMERNRIESELNTFSSIEQQLEDIETLLEIAEEESEESLLDEAETFLKNIERELNSLEVKTVLSGEFDKNNAIVTIHAGAGGTESCDWAEMLMRMYLRWAERKGFETEILDLQENEEAGIKSATILIKGAYAYGLLRAEHGTHRLVRISPFDSNARRHTSFCGVIVVPEIDEDIDIEIKDEDLRIDTYRASGAGGQHVNKTDSAVRITHLPTGIVVTCQSERSQIQNRQRAMKILKARLYELERQKREEKIAEARGEHKTIAWGNQIRSYVFHPYQMVKDHRTGIETSNINAVMDGEIDQFIEGFLKQKAREGKVGHQES
ncbi:peptide chain release factor 2 [Desulfurobacterium thermolithotrophum]|uniref:peptide chain release factor 2 n=1 Tax=Desulfurobacterium thermolithotrophum TaxID=64160 RepID=UPI0019548A07|nr:peptide chain release factor 2 [Desulfurobacterium thermolithotrophum]